MSGGAGARVPEERAGAGGREPVAGAGGGTLRPAKSGDVTYPTHREPRVAPGPGGRRRRPPGVPAVKRCPSDRNQP
ncbi:hypothetical protein CP967_02985 [Streptomyces nitrosporeus]|uniref:Uncharacterized protein n=1 Tax=Streptomyces nitrosporeus TaxID=28894 RepID=A0A5J6F4V1_9ACTN|nr:hypothetical protein CP967_02985 [Streptomyces nitrosporeus]